MTESSIVGSASGRGFKLEGTEQYSREAYDEYVKRRKCMIDGVNRTLSCYTLGAYGRVLQGGKTASGWRDDYAAAGFYTSPDLGKDQVRLAYVLCKEDL